MMISDKRITTYVGFAKFNKLLNFADRQKMLNHENKQNFYSNILHQSFVDVCTDKKNCVSKKILAPKFHILDSIGVWYSLF